MHFMTFEMTANWFDCCCLSASQMSESSHTELKPSLGSTPTAFRFQCKKTECDLLVTDHCQFSIYFFSFAELLAFCLDD